MNKLFHYIDTSLCGLFQNVTEYYLIDNGLVLESYYESERKTKRHKFIIFNRWERRGRNSNMEKPVILDEIKADILAKARASINFQAGE